MNYNVKVLISSFLIFQIQNVTKIHRFKILNERCVRGKSLVNGKRKTHAICCCSYFALLTGREFLPIFGFWIGEGDVFCCRAWGNGVIQVQETITTIYKEPRIGNISK